MKAQNVLRGAAYLVALAVAVLFYVQSQNAVARLTALSNPPAEAVTPAPAPAPVSAADMQASATRQYEAMTKELARQAEHNKAVLAARAAAAPKPVEKPKPAPTPPAYSFAAPGPALVPLEGWVDQPNKDRPGRVHTNLMVRHVKPTVKPRTPSRAPCLVMTAKPAQRFEFDTGWLEVPARTIPVPCGQ